MWHDHHCELWVRRWDLAKLANLYHLNFVIWQQPISTGCHHSKAYLPPEYSGHFFLLLEIMLSSKTLSRIRILLPTELCNFAANNVNGMLSFQGISVPIFLNPSVVHNMDSMYRELTIFKENTLWADYNINWWLFNAKVPNVLSLKFHKNCTLTVFWWKHDEDQWWWWQW